MKSFLLVYDRAAGKLLLEEDFRPDERQRALQKRLALEEQYRTDPNIEVVVLNAESREVLEHTHGRYFKTLQELIEQG